MGQPNLSPLEGGDFSGARPNLLHDVSDYILDLEMNYFKRLETHNEEQLWMDNTMQRTTRESQANGILFDERQDRRKLAARDKNEATSSKGARVSSEKKTWYGSWPLSITGEEMKLPY